MKHVFRIVAIAVLMIAVGLPTNARADVAPPAQPPGFNPEPGTETTQVRMVAETVLIEVQPGAPAEGLGQAKVTADFTMRNLGSETENMAVRFPIGRDDGWFGLQEIGNIQVLVNGRIVPIRRIMSIDPLQQYESVPWVEFDVNFPVNMDIQIRVSYNLLGTGYDPFESYYYIFHTGAGWKDTIGTADLIVRFPYEVNIYNIVFDETGWASTTANGKIAGREIRWHFENFEPTIEDDFEITVVIPSVWRKILIEQANVNTNPNDGEAWGRLGKLYKEITSWGGKGFRSDEGGKELFSLSRMAYERATSLLPHDALWHAGFADLLASYAFFEGIGGLDTSHEKLRAMQEIYIALELAPTDPKVQEIAQYIYFIFPDAIRQLESGYDFLWLTATPLPPPPTVAPSLEPTTTPEVTSTVPAAETAVPMREAAPNPTTAPPSARNPLCGSLFVPLALVWLARRKRRVDNPLL